MSWWSAALDRWSFRQPVDVIMPVYRGRELTHEALKCLQHSEPVGRFRLVLINDASPEVGMKDMLRAFVRQCPHPVVLLEHSRNQGFTVSVNEGMRQSRMRNVVLLNADALVSPGWLDRLTAQARQGSDIATLTPFSNNATIASFPQFCTENELPAGWQRSELDKLFEQVLQGQQVEIPTAVGFCMWIRRAALRQLGPFDERAFPRGYGEENDFSRRAVKAGWRNMLACDVFVQHVGGVSFASERESLQQQHAQRLLEMHPEYDQAVQEFVRLDPLRPMRERVLQQMQVQPASGSSPAVCAGSGLS